MKMLKEFFYIPPESLHKDFDRPVVPIAHKTDERQVPRVPQNEIAE